VRTFPLSTPRKLATHSLTKAHLNIPAVPAVTNVKPAQPAPLREPRETAAPAPQLVPAPAFVTPTHSVGVVERILRFFRGSESAPSKPASPARSGEGRDRGERSGGRRDGRGGKQGGRDGQRRDEQQLADARDT